MTTIEKVIRKAIEGKLVATDFAQYLEISLDRISDNNAADILRLAYEDGDDADWLDQLITDTIREKNHA